MNEHVCSLFTKKSICIMLEFILTPLISNLPRRWELIEATNSVSQENGRNYTERCDTLPQILHMWRNKVCKLVTDLVVRLDLWRQAVRTWRQVNWVAERRSQWPSLDVFRQRTVRWCSFEYGSDGNSKTNGEEDAWGGRLSECQFHCDMAVISAIVNITGGEKWPTRVVCLRCSYS